MTTIIAIIIWYDFEINVSSPFKQKGNFNGYKMQNFYILNANIFLFKIIKVKK